jgi:predicted GIY-YIG superfamily endonuclease
MSVLVRQRKGKSGWWVIATRNGRRRYLRFNDQPTAQQAARALGVQTALGNLALTPLPEIDLKELKSDQTCVYFIQIEKAGPIKIGYTKNLPLRLQSYRTFTHKEVRLLAFIPGWGQEEEYALHLLFSHQRVKREWFTATQDLIFLIRCLSFICRESKVTRGRSDLKRMSRIWQDLKGSLKQNDEII